jgi:hypothetical protein
MLIRWITVTIVENRIIDSKEITSLLYSKATLATLASSQSTKLCS